MLSFLLFLGAELVARFKNSGKEHEKVLQKQHFFLYKVQILLQQNFLFLGQMHICIVQRKNLHQELAAEPHF